MKSAEGGGRLGDELPASSVSRSLREARAPKPPVKGHFRTLAPGEGSLANYRVAFIPDYLPSDSTLAQANAPLTGYCLRLQTWG